MFLSLVLLIKVNGTPFSQLLEPNISNHPCFLSLSLLLFWTLFNIYKSRVNLDSTFFGSHSTSNPSRNSICSTFKEYTDHFSATHNYVYKSLLTLLLTSALASVFSTQKPDRSEIYARSYHYSAQNIFHLQRKLQSS